MNEGLICLVDNPARKKSFGDHS